MNEFQMALKAYVLPVNLLANRKQQPTAFMVVCLELRWTNTKNNCPQKNCKKLYSTVGFETPLYRTQTAQYNTEGQQSKNHNFLRHCYLFKQDL